jgi:hypothetical protein
MAVALMSPVASIGAPPRRLRVAVARARALALACACVCAVSAAPARADDGEGPASGSDPRTTRAFFAGVVLELAPFAVGGMMIADSGNRTVRRASVYVSTTGFTLAPLVAHGLEGEWGRGAVFASVPFACGVGLAVLMQQPDGDVLTEEGTKTTRIPFWIMASSALAASAAGVIDAALAPGRSRAHGLYFAPSRVPSGVAMNVGGTF